MDDIVSSGFAKAINSIRTGMAILRFSLRVTMLITPLSRDCDR